MEETRVICPHCGKASQGIDTVCPYCGKKLERHRIRTLLIVAAFLILLAAIFYGTLHWGMDMLVMAHSEELIEAQERRAFRDLEDHLQRYYPSRQQVAVYLQGQDYDAASAEYLAQAWPVSYEEHARDAARRILHDQAKSPAEIQKILEDRGFTEEEIQFALEALQIDPQEQALRRAEEYLESGNFSRIGLYQQLCHSQYSDEYAWYAINHCSADWKQQALSLAQQELQRSPELSREELQEFLQAEDFDQEEQRFALEGCLGPGQ